MNELLSRRHFLASAAGVALGATLAGGAAHAAQPTLARTAPVPAPRQIHHALKINMLPREMSDEEKFQLAARAGYQGIDGVPLESDDEIQRQAELARRMGVPFHGLVFGWAAFGEPDPEAHERDIARMETALRQAKLIGVDTVLLVPGRVTEEVAYQDVWTRSQASVRRLIPAAEEHGVIIGIENVWSRFLLSPLEFRDYIDQLDSPFVRAYFDIGNVIIQGHAQDWIRTLGNRIIKLDVKDFRRRDFQWVNLGEGDVNWPAVCAALDEIGYKGWATVEMRGGDEAYLTDVTDRVGRLLINPPAA